MGFRMSVRTSGLSRPVNVPPVRIAGIVGCLAFGAATILYVIGVEYGSGDRVAEFDLRSGDGSVVAGANARTYGPLSLVPGMNPMRAVLHAEHGRLALGQSIGVNAALRDGDGRAVWSESRSLARSSARSKSSQHSSTSVVLTKFDVPRAGDYMLDVSLREPAGGRVRAVRLELRRQVASANPAVTWAGAGAAALSALIALFGGRAQGNDAAAQRRAA